jgi:hypothetical protein
MAVSVVAIVLLTATAFALQNASDLFERARMLDESNQNLNEAITLYNQVLDQAKGQRSLAARTQYRIGVLYERLGRKAEAQRAFKIIVRQYPDQTGLARQARARLAAAGISHDETGKTLVKRTGPSPDGWYFETLTLPAGGQLFPALDPAKQHLFVLIFHYSDEESDAGDKRANRQALHAEYEPSTLLVIDTGTNSVVKTIPFSVYINEIAFNPANNKLYAAAQLDGHVKVIDTTMFTETRINIPGHPTSLAVNANTNKIYVASQGFAGNDKLFVIDGAAQGVTGPYDLDGVAGQVVVNSATNRIYAVAPPKTRVFNGADNSIVTDLAVGVIGVDPAHNIIYIESAGLEPGNIQALDGNTHGLIASFGFAGQPSAIIGIDPSINRLYVPGKNQQIAIVDTANQTELGRLLVTDDPVHLAVDPQTGNAYVCHNGTPAKIGVFAGRNLDGEIPEDFSDSFDSSTLNPSWTVMSGKDTYSLTSSPGHLRLPAYGFSAAKPRLLLMRMFHGDFWTLEVKASYFTGRSGGDRGLFFGIYLGAGPNVGAPGKPDIRNANNAVYIYRSRADWNGCCPGGTSQRFFEEGKPRSASVLAPNDTDAYVWRIKRDGRTITVERSDDGTNFKLAGAYTFGRQIDGVIQYLAISYFSFADSDVYANYDYVRLRKISPNQKSMN